MRTARPRLKETICGLSGRPTSAAWKRHEMAVRRPDLAIRPGAAPRRRGMTNCEAAFLARFRCDAIRRAASRPAWASHRGDAVSAPASRIGGRRTDAVCIGRSRWRVGDGRWCERANQGCRSRYAAASDGARRCGSPDRKRRRSRCCSPRKSEGSFGQREADWPAQRPPHRPHDLDHERQPAGALLIGEAARLTHNGTGEGISQAMASGIHAAEAVARAVRGEATESVAQRGYLRALRRRFTAEFAGGHLLRDIVSSGTFDGLARAYNMPTFRRAIDWVVGAVMPGLTRKRLRPGSSSRGPGPNRQPSSGRISSSGSAA